MTLADGTALSPALGVGAFAEQTLVAAGQATKVDPRAKPETAGLLGCGVMAGLGAAMYTGDVGRGDSVAVFGCGGVGNAAIAGARLAGANPIIAVDIDPRKLAWAEEFGATHTVNSRDTDPVEAIRALTDGNGADVCIEAVGRPEVLEQAFYARDLAGTVVQVGVPDPSMKIELPMIEFFGRGGALKPSWYGDCLPSRDFPMLIDLYLSGRLDLDRFVSETIALDAVEDAFHKMERGEVLRSRRGAVGPTVSLGRGAVVAQEQRLPAVDRDPPPAVLEQRGRRIGHRRDARGVAHVAPRVDHVVPERDAERGDEGEVTAQVGAVVGGGAGADRARSSRCRTSRPRRSCRARGSPCRRASPRSSGRRRLPATTGCPSAASAPVAALPHLVMVPCRSTIT